MLPARCVYWTADTLIFIVEPCVQGMKLSGAVGTKARLTSHDVTAPAIAADKTEALTGVWQTIDLDHGTVEILPMAGPRK